MLFFAQFRELQSLRYSEISDKPLKGIDSHRPVFLVSIAGILAGVRTNASADRRKGIAVDDCVPCNFVGLFVSAAILRRLSDGVDPPTNVRTAGTPIAARRCFRNVPRAQMADFRSPCCSSLDCRFFHCLKENHRFFPLQAYG